MVYASEKFFLYSIADQTRSKYDQHTLYRRPLHCTPAQNTTCGERDHPRLFSTGWKNYPAHHDLSDRARPTPTVFYSLDQGPLIADTFIFPERERAESGVNGPLDVYYHAGHTDESRMSKAAVDNCGKGVGYFYLS